MFVRLKLWTRDCKSRQVLENRVVLAKSQVWGAPAWLSWRGDMISFVIWRAASGARARQAEV